MVPSLEVGDILLTSVSTAAQSARDEPVPEPTPPTVVIEPVSSVCACMHMCGVVCVCVCARVRACVRVFRVHLFVCLYTYVLVCMYLYMCFARIHALCPVNISRLLIAIKTYNRVIMVCTLFHNFDLQCLVNWLFSVYHSL